MTQLSALEGVKTGSRYLAGELADELAAAGDGFGADGAQLLKFHGIYQQDDRDTRRERAQAGLGRDVVCMVRAAIPGGVLTSDQYLAVDRLADTVGAPGLRITTRQGLQWHFVKKTDLAQLVATLNRNLVTTLAACGDVVRNVMACPAPLPGREDAVLLDHARRLAGVLKPRTRSYWDLWLDGERALSAVEPVGGGGDPATAAGERGVDEVEPLYGATYLPRKFKIGFAFPDDNCVDVYSNDVGLVPHYAGGRLTAVTVLVGGGLGMTHNNAATYPRLADPLTTIAPDELTAVVTTIVAVQRDHGDRTDRKHARLKYLVDDWGLDRFAAEVARRLGHALAPPWQLAWDATDDHLGWHRQHDGRWFLGIRVASGRLVDGPGVAIRSAVREVVEHLGAGVRFTPRQDVLLTGVEDDDRADVEAILARRGVPPVSTLTPVARHALACPALPTCGLALTEAERALPDLVTAFERRLDELGLAGAPVHVRVTGCPNGCARPYSTEIGVVGRGKDHYTLYLGGAADGTRLNGELADRVAFGDIVDVLTPALAGWRDERTGDEPFGDWCDRVGLADLRRRCRPDAPA